MDLYLHPCWQLHQQSMIRVLLCFCFWLAVSSTLIITSPLVTDFPNNQVDYFYANFGEVPYGKTKSFDLVILNHSLCGNISELPHLTRPTYLAIKTDYSNLCSYTKRAINAQSLGAQGIVIASPNVDYAIGNVIEADDGNGKKVHITTLFITNEAIGKLSKLVKIEIVAKYPVPKQKISTLSLFLSSAKRSSYVFLRDFQKEYKYLKDHIKIDLIYHTIDCPSCSQQNCYLDKYCSFDYQGYQVNSGQKIIREELHQFAIFNQRGVEKWMEYMNLFDQYCGSDWANIDQCTRQILNQLKMDDGYLANPGETLANWRVKETRLGFDSFPEVAINNMIYRGNFDSDEIVDTLCTSLSSPPKYCKERAKPQAEIEPNSNKHVVTIIVVSIIALMVAIGLGIWLYRRFIKTELTSDMSSRVGELVAHYANKVSGQKKKQKERMMESLEEEL